MYVILGIPSLNSNPKELRYVERMRSPRNFLNKTSIMERQYYINVCVRQLHFSLVSYGMVFSLLGVMTIQRSQQKQRGLPLCLVTRSRLMFKLSTSP